MRVGITGHRWIPAADRPGLAEALRSALVQYDVTVACSGMGIGADQMFAQACVEVKVPFIAFVPCRAHEAGLVVGVVGGKERERE